MAYVQKSGKRYCVKKGNTGETLSCFTGKEGKMNADAELKRLHRKNMPKASNRGKSAQKKQDKR